MVDDIKESVGGKNFPIIAIGFVIILVFMMAKNNNSESNQSVSTAYASYPDSVTNADVIISTIQNSINYSQSEIQDDITDLSNTIQEGFESQKDLTNKIGTDILGSISDSKNAILSEENKNTNMILSGVESVSKSQKNLENVVYSQSEKILDSTKNLSNDISNLSGLTYTAIKEQKEFFEKSDYTGDSLVEALKELGNSSYTFRKELAKANDIPAYIGSETQNNVLLGKFKNGTLIIP